MSKEVIWTISYGDHCMVLETRRRDGIDEKDWMIETPLTRLHLALKKLSEKYCNKGFAVLFDVE